VPVADKVIEVPLLNEAEQVAPQLMPATLVEVTTPAPANTTESVGRLKLAVILVASFNVKLQAPAALLQFAVTLPVPLVQPVKFDALSGVGMIEIGVPTG
jgi:hypothetical protein